MARVLLESIDTIEIGGVARIKDDGSRDVSVLLAATAVVRARFGAAVSKSVDGKQELSRPADLTPDWRALAASDDSIAGLLERLRDPHAWGGLYKINEVIRYNVEGGRSPCGRGMGHQENTHTVQADCLQPEGAWPNGSTWRVVD
jgi:hypothetical protein